jgi:hypothetical protein
MKVGNVLIVDVEEFDKERIESLNFDLVIVKSESIKKSWIYKDIQGFFGPVYKFVGLFGKTKFNIGDKVITLKITNPPDDWNDPGNRQFGKIGIVTRISDSHGLCLQVKYCDDTAINNWGWFSPNELSKLSNVEERGG